jgi:hypothetical protein
MCLFLFVLSQSISRGDSQSIWGARLSIFSFISGLRVLGTYIDIVVRRRIVDMCVIVWWKIVNGRILTTLLR